MLPDDTEVLWVDDLVDRHPAVRVARSTRRGDVQVHLKISSGSALPDSLTAPAPRPSPAWRARNGPFGV